MLDLVDLFAEFDLAPIDAIGKINKINLFPEHYVEVVLYPGTDYLTGLLLVEGPEISPAAKETNSQWRSTDDHRCHCLS